MVSGKRHERSGGLRMLGRYLLYKQLRREQPNLIMAVGSYYVGKTIATLPDELEPPTSPNHRGFFHSKTFLLGATTAAGRIMKNPNLTPEEKYWWLAALEVYCGHLLQDSRTPAGLPAI